MKKTNYRRGIKPARNQKLGSWTTKDVVLNAVTYAINLLIMIFLFVLTVGLTGKDIEAYFENVTSFVHFLILLILTFSVMVFYFLYEDRDFMKNAANTEMLFLIIELSLMISFSFGNYINPYLRPLALVAVLTLFLSNRKTAIFMNVIFCVIIFLFDTFSPVKMFDYGSNYYPALIMCFSSGIIATFCTDKVRSRSTLLLRSVLISVPTIICVGMSLIEHGSSNGPIADLIYGALSGPLAVAIFIVLLPIFEVLFMKVSCFKFSELTDHKAKLIRKMITEAPGTFNHSIVVSNIAEACASAIGEDSLLARTCAYYHDVGKLRRPEYFKENQSDGVDTHKDLTPELSANIIKSHTIDGYNLVLKNGLPREIADVCIQHHGTLPIIYFYDKAKKFTDGEVDLSQYCYPGPKPKTKIAAIIMIADGCEAAARSLQDRSRENVKKVVRKIVNDRMELGQFEDCEITLKEINIIIHTVVNNLTGIYHNRIEYPKVNLDGMEL